MTSIGSASSRNSRAIAARDRPSASFSRSWTASKWRFEALEPVELAQRGDQLAALAVEDRREPARLSVGCSTP